MVKDQVFLGRVPRSYLIKRIFLLSASKIILESDVNLGCYIFDLNTKEYVQFKGYLKDQSKEDKIETAKFVEVLRQEGFLRKRLGRAAKSFPYTLNSVFERSFINGGVIDQSEIIPNSNDCFGLWDGMMCLVDRETRKNKRSIILGEESEIGFVQYLEEFLIILVRDLNKIEVWDTNKNECIKVLDMRELTGLQKCYIYKLLIILKDTVVAVRDVFGSEENIIYVIDIDSSKLKFQISVGNYFLGILKLDEKNFVSGHKDGVLKFWDLALGKLKFEYKLKNLSDENNGVIAMMKFKEKQIVVSCGEKIYLLSLN